jgi:hypothetical protein
MRTRFAVICVGLVAVLTVFTATAMGAGMLVGTWKLNVAKSKYSPGPAPLSNTVKFDVIDGGIKLVADGVDSQGRKTHNEYTAKFDGTDNPTKPTLEESRIPMQPTPSRTKRSTTIRTKPQPNSRGKHSRLPGM